MVMGMGVGAKEAALFHLLTHAFFKAGLFLCAGVVIHAIHTQDTRQMGGLRKGMPITFWAYTICAAALAGVPFFSGFLSKDAIFIGAFAWARQYGGVAFMIPILGLISAGLTAFYVVRQWKQVFLGENKGGYHSEQIIHDADTFMKIPIGLLAILSLFIWFSFNPLDAAHGWFFQLFRTDQPDGAHAVVAFLSVAVTSAGLLLGYFSTMMSQVPSVITMLEGIYESVKKFLAALFAQITRGLQWLNEHSPETDQHLFLIAPLQKIAHWSDAFDRKVIDRAVNGVSYLVVSGAHLFGRFDQIIVDGTVNALAWLAGFFGNRIRHLQNGKIQSYFIVMLLGVLVLVFWVLIRPNGH